MTAKESNKESGIEKEIEQDLSIPEILPVIPIRDLIVYPFIIVPLSIGREQSVAAVEAALGDHRKIILTGQKDGSKETPEEGDLYEYGTVAMIMRMLKLPDGKMRVLVQGLSRCKIEYFTLKEPFREAKITVLDDEIPEDGNLEVEALMRHVKDMLERSTSLGKTLSSEVLVIANSMENPGRLADLVASNIQLKVHEAQHILEELQVIKRLKRVNELLIREISLLEIQQQISNQARGEMDRSQRDYYLRQQLKVIQEELGEGNELQEEIQSYREKIKDLNLPEEAGKEISKQLRRLENMHPDTAETAVIRTYLDWMTELPWNNHTEDNLNIKNALNVLDEDHYGLKEIKERILEFLSVRKLNPELKNPILCFVGPPGVGKTSLGRSIARALDRNYVRISLGGVRDEAEIRGHRRTYVGAMPGRIIQGIHIAGSNNPVFVLDEIDKMGLDFRGDPSSALLEVLDPEQNINFRDHYLGVPFDLTKVMFILTANTLDTLQPAFRDRLEIIELGSYTLEEKLKIARRYIIPKQLKEHGLTKKLLHFTKAALISLISSHTRESGLRQMERLIAKLCRKTARKIADGAEKKITVSKKNLSDFLGSPKIFQDQRLKKHTEGIAAGLAWTSVGGEILFVEATLLEGGRGDLNLTGQLGDVMKESAQIALSLIRSRAKKYGIAEEKFQKFDIHIHFPEGAIPKDGPSAGITIASVLKSVFTGTKVRCDVAMTGELTLRGEVLPIGGLKEKAMAAIRAGIENVVFPHQNQNDIEDIPEEIRESCHFIPVKDIDDVFKIVFNDK
ncbi:MAG: endopeptidase La [Acidobacteria bacterium]|nr:MAG: endopeptidase La [Acidobacteriota bacterium]